MRKSLIFLMAVVLLVFYLAPLSFSQTLITEDFYEGEKRTNAGIYCAAFIPGKKIFKTGFYVAGQASYDFARYLAVGIEGGYMQTDIHSNDIRIGTLQSAPVFGNMILKAPLDMETFVFTPYVVGGLGALFNNIDESDNVEGNGKVEMNTPFLSKIGGGCDFIMNDTIVVSFEASYIFAKIKFTQELVNQDFGLEKFDLNAGFVGGAFKLRF